MTLDIYLLLEEKITGEKIEYSYYRNFNALQGYFDQKFDLSNSDEVLLSSQAISTIYEILKTVHYTSERAAEMLPTYPGPFFGIYEYDRIYYSYVSQAASDFYHTKFIDFFKIYLYFTSNW